VTFRAATRDPERQTYYQLLGVDATATTADITRAYRQAMKECHPDRLPPAQRERTEILCKHLNHAYATLKDPAKRKAYDETIRAAEVQEQIMNRYVGGLAGPGLNGFDPHQKHLRRERTASEKAELRRADRAAMFSLVRTAIALTVVVVGLLLAYAVIASLAGLLT
jgi:DnaJ-class molecular chaperone